MPAATPDLSALADEAKAAGLAAGLDAVGIAPAAPFLSSRAQLVDRKQRGLHGGMQFTFRNPDRATDPSRSLEGAASLVVGARNYRRESPTDEPPTPARGSVARYSWIDHYGPLRAALQRVAAVLEAEGWRARLLVDDNALVDREAAYRAGLGWYGKNTNLLLHGRGSWFLLGSVVTDAPLPSNREPVADGCGPCTQCLPACPTGALVAPGVLDARRCLAWLLQAPGVFPREHREALGGRIYGCDDCQEACPPNRIEVRRRPPAPAEPGSQAAVDLVEIVLESDDGALLGRFGRWYVAQRQPRYLRRNALIALGNVGTARDPRVAAAVERGLGSDDAIVRGAAVWAAARLGRRDLVDAVAAVESDPDVLAELASLPAPRRT